MLISFNKPFFLLSIENVECIRKVNHLFSLLFLSTVTFGRIIANFTFLFSFYPLNVSSLAFWTTAKIGHPHIPSPISELSSSPPPPQQLSGTLGSAKLLESCSHPCIHSLRYDRGTYNSSKHEH
ncbi:hypothetical protein TNIN_99721 [Trichonephila inaurata madagascariensis]|uniref:Uncharacterized protein n=1 Tax=Trichonephila inaurata madagascariensis TaxID=2747483 RepID=A0A8X6J426_9ARAC|nr:hypothetical protein TNIN_99721 [Trichonephila inaurata madagascariensis]